MKILTMAAALSAAISGSASAQGCVDSTDRNVVIIENGTRFEVPMMLRYSARIGSRDLHNSAGVRLMTTAVILQQDRANYHKSGRADASGPFRDGPDGYFTTLARRTQISQAHIYYECWMSARQVHDFEVNLHNAEIPGVVDVAVFQHPNGGLGLALSQVD